MAESRPRIVIIAGPTATGKTAAGIEIALHCRGEIVSADSIQIYRQMDIGSAKPTPEERSIVPHHMIDICDPDEDFSAGDYVRLARQCIRDVSDRGRVPVVVGGTGLYLRLLLGGIIDVPPSDEGLRTRLRAKEKREGAGALHALLQQVDPEAAAEIPPANLARVIRALEVFELTRMRFSALTRNHGFRDRPYQVLFIVLHVDRAILYERIDRRVDRMMKDGLLEEVSYLTRLGYSRNLKAMQSIGYRHAGMVLAGEIPVDEAIRLMKRDTRRYAKRQLTWFRSEPEAVWCDPADLAGVRLMVDHFLER
ncbi:MAG: tRNA (adenosine(37)-N6)-dimethylallyltransferase MiaA [Desulfomonile sp.]|nr:tRNA (adenosine(37)-N6)-dimethylallyltransferase MiaA [Desulfomonile sp.]